MIRQKLTVLLESGIINQETHDYCLRVLSFLLENKIIDEDAQADVFLTHLAMADARRQEGNAIVDKLDDFILNEIHADAKFEEAKILWKKLEENEFEASELDYFYLHIINMIKEG